MTDQRSIEDQHSQCRRWAGWLREAGYAVHFMYTGNPAPFDREWQVWTDTGYSPLATIDIDGCGARWNGDDALWLRVIGPHEGVTA